MFRKKKSYHNLILMEIKTLLFLNPAILPFRDNLLQWGGLNLKLVLTLQSHKNTNLKLHKVKLFYLHYKRY